jgi:hypothetical protein
MRSLFDSLCNHVLQLSGELQTSRFHLKIKVDQQNIDRFNGSLPEEIISQFLDNSNQL